MIDSVKTLMSNPQLAQMRLIELHGPLPYDQRFLLKRYSINNQVTNSLLYHSWVKVTVDGTKKILIHGRPVTFPNVILSLTEFGALTLRSELETREAVASLWAEPDEELL